MAMHPRKYSHLYTDERIYLVWCLWLIKNESSAIFVLKLFVHLQLKIEEAFWFYL